MSSYSPPQIHRDSSPQLVCQLLAQEIASGVRTAAEEGRNFTLGLATGSSPIPLYRELIKIHRDEGLSFANVTTFNLDEYNGLKPGSLQSYDNFMRRNLFDHLDIPLNQINIPSGMIPADEIAEYCDGYEAAILAAGGIDFQILGIGRTGHIGFNEPPSTQDSKTRLISLHPVTREDAAPDFNGLENVPKDAITMGISTILQSKRIALLAWGEKKAEIVAQALASEPDENLPASFLNLHSSTAYYLDDAAASQIS